MNHLSEPPRPTPPKPSSETGQRQTAQRQIARSTAATRLRGAVVVATALRPDLDERPLRFASDLARRFRLELRLVHALEGRPVATAERSIQEIVRRLAATESSLRVAFRISWEAVPGNAADPSAALTDAATEAGAALIVAGALTPRPRFLRSAVSTFFSLVDRAPLPVLVLSDDTAVDFSRSALHVLIADDLSPRCSAAVHTAFALATAAGDARLIHAHVETSATTLPESTAALRRRARPHLAALLAAGGSYEAKLSIGDTATQLAVLAEAGDADLTVVGRSTVGDARASAFGAFGLPLGHQILAALMGQRAATLVVPPGAEQLISTLQQR